MKKFYFIEDVSTITQLYPYVVATYYVTSDDCTFMGFDEKPSKKWVKSTNEEINVLLTEYTEREQLIKIFSNLLRK